MDKKIIIDYLESLNIDFVEEIALEKFPECSIKRQNWGINAPFVIIRKGFFVRAVVFINQKEKNGQSIIGINGGMDPLAFALFGFIFHYVLRGDFLCEVEDAMREGIKERYSIITGNSIVSNRSILKKKGNNIPWKIIMMGLMTAFILCAAIFLFLFPPKNNNEAINSFNMVRVEGGSFIMGRDSGLEWDQKHKVTLSSFYIGKTEVTQEQWSAIMNYNPSHFKGDDLPVENVTYEEVLTFIQKLNNQSGKNYRLPTEAEWEFAARGGNLSNDYKYSGSNIFEDIAWCEQNSNSTTHIVGTKNTNELGLNDMSGNVNEWCSDWYYPYPKEDQINPKGETKDPLGRHVIRGGGWNTRGGTNYVGLEITDRTDGGDEKKHHSALGFRLAHDI